MPPKLACGLITPFTPLTPELAKLESIIFSGAKVTILADYLKLFYSFLLISDGKEAFGGQRDGRGLAEPHPRRTKDAPGPYLLRSKFGWRYPLTEFATKEVRAGYGPDKPPRRNAHGCLHTN